MALVALVAQVRPNLRSAEKSRCLGWTGRIQLVVQHLDRGGVDGQASGVDAGAGGPVADEVAGRACAATGCRAAVLARDRQGIVERGSRRRRRRVGAAGGRWFRERGGMPTFMLAPIARRYLSFPEREQIALLRAQGAGVRDTARRLGRAPSTISREFRRNAATRGGKPDYRASVAQRKAELMGRRPKTAKLVANERLHDYVQERLSGQIRGPTRPQPRDRRRQLGRVVTSRGGRTAGGRTRGARSRSLGG